MEHARNAADIAPGYPPNVLSLAEALAAVEEPEASEQAFVEALALAGQWRDRGDPDAAEWLERAETRQGLR